MKCLGRCTNEQVAVLNICEGSWSSLDVMMEVTFS